MIKDYFQIKDTCRKGLIKYLEKTFATIPETENPMILDIGCGTGVQTLWIADNYPGNITAIDTDKNALDWLQNKISEKKSDYKVTLMHNSFFHFKANPNYFDIIIAEGFLNVIGFETGLLNALGFLRRNGYFIIHDEFKDHENKCNFIKNNNCLIVYTLYLNEKVWWNDYYSQLESEISAITNHLTRELFKNDIKEIEYYKADSSPFRSIYYVIQKL